MSPTEISELIADLLAMASLPTLPTPTSGFTPPLSAVFAESLGSDASSSPESVHPPSSDDSSEANLFFVPSKFRTDLESATHAGQILTQCGDCFARNGQPVYFRDGQFKSIVPANLGSLIEGAGFSIVTISGEDFESQLLNESTAKRLLASPGFTLPRIQIISPCPVFKRCEDDLVVVHTYDSDLEVYALGGGVQNDISIEEATQRLVGLLKDFRFASPSDCSRALAYLITPAIALGDLLPYRIPLTVIEADQSQTGKGYLAKIVGRIYGSEQSVVTQRSGGSGSLQSSFDACIQRGNPFISIDNLRGKAESSWLESFLTEDNYLCRCAYSPETNIKPRRFIVSLTSNAAEMTKDLANRSSMIRLRKQEQSYQFQEYPEGDLLSHIQANQGIYLGAVYAALREWIKTGRPRTDESRHSFRPWAQSLDWIVQHIFDLPPLLDGQVAILDRITRPEISLLRSIAREVHHQGHLGKYLTATHLFKLVEGTETMDQLGYRLKDTATGQQEAGAIVTIGKQMKRSFKGQCSLTIEVDEYIVTRTENGRNSSSNRVPAYRFDFKTANGSTGSTSSTG